MFTAESKIPAFGRDKRRSFLPSVKKPVSSADFEDQGGAAPNSAPFIHSPAPPSPGHAHSTHGHAHSTHGHGHSTHSHGHSTHGHGHSTHGHAHSTQEGHAHSTQEGHAHSTQEGHAHSTQEGHAHSTQQGLAYFPQQGHAPLQQAHPSVPLGGRVCISGVKFGTLLYFGETHITGGLWCGIELDDPDGKHDGEVEGRRYFRCRPLHGIFAPVEKVQAVPQDPRHQHQQPVAVAPGFEGGLPHSGGSSGIAPGKRAFVGGSKEPSEKIANLTYVKDTPLCPGSPERAAVGSYKELSGKYKDVASAHAADDDCSVGQDVRRVAGEAGDQVAAPRDRDERCEQTAAQQSGSSSSSRFRGIPKLGGGVAAAAGIPKPRQPKKEEVAAPPRPAADRDQEHPAELERAPPQPRQSGLPVASRLPKFGRPSKGGASSPGGGEAVSPRDLSKTLSLGPLEDAAAATQEGSGSSVEESDPLSPDVKKNLKSDSRQYLNLTFDAESRSSPSNQSQNLPDVVSSVSSSPDSRASLSDSRDSESALRLSLSAGGTHHLTSSSLPDPMTSSGGQEFSSDLDHSDLMEGYEMDDEFAEPTPLGQVVRTDMTSLPVESVATSELRKTQQGFSVARDVTQPDSQELGDGLDRTFEYEEEDDGGGLHQGGLTRAFSSGTEPDSSSTLFGSSCALAHSSTTDAALCDSGGLPEESEAHPGGRRGGGGGDDTFLVPQGVQEVEPPLEQFAEVDRVDAMSDGSLTTTASTDSGGAVKLRTSSGGTARRRGPMTDSGISEQGDLEGGELGARPDVILQAQGDDGQLAEDLRAGHARCDRPVSLLSTTSADTGYVADGDSESGTLTANSPLDWSERGVSARPPPREQAPLPPRLPGDGGKMQQQQQTKAASPVNEGVTEDDRTEADRDIPEAGEKGKTSRELTTMTTTAGGQPGPALVSSTGTVMASSATESMIASDPALLLQPGRQDVKTALGSEEEKASARTEDDDDNEAVVKDGAAEDEEGDVGKPDEHDDEGDEHGDEEEEGEEAKRRKSMSDTTETPGSPASRASGKKGAGVRKGSMPVTKRPMPNTKAAASKLADYIKAPPPTPRPKEERAEEAKNKKNVANKHRASTAKGDADASSAGDVSSVEGGRRASRVKVEKEVPKIVKRAPVKNKWEDIMSQIEANKDQAKPKPKAEVKSTLAAYLSAPAPAPRKEREPKKEVKPRSVLQHNPTPDYSKVKSKLSSTLPPPPPPRAQSPPASSRRLSHGGSKPGVGQKEGVHLDLSSNLSSARSSRSDLSCAGDSSLNHSGRRTERASRNSISKGPAHLKNERSTSVASTRSDTSQAGTSVKAMNARNTQKSETARTDPSPTKPKKSTVKSSIPPPDQNRSRTVATKSARPSTAPLGSGSAAPSTSNHVKSSAPDLVSTARSARGQEVARLEALCETRTKELTLAKLQLKQQTLGFDAMAVVVRYLNEQLDAFSCPLVTEKLKEAEKGLEAFREKTEALTRRKEELEAELKELQTKHQAAASEVERLSGELTAAKEAHDKSATEQQESHESQLAAQREHLLACHKEELLRVKERHERELNHLKKAHERNLGDLKLENQIATDNLRLKHLEDIEALRSKHDAQMEELHKQHRDKLEDITKRFESIKTTLGEKVETLRGECDELRNRAKMSEDALLRDADVKVQMALEPYRHLPKEIESLKTVIEMRNDEIQKLRTKNMDLDKQLEELPIAREKIISLQQKVENLEAIVNIKSDHEKQLHEKCGNLMRKYDRESKANKRLSMDYEELMWRMSQSSELDMGSQESLNYRRQISRSPPGSESGSPTLARRQLSSPAPPLNGGDQSPRYSRRSAASASGENSLERRLKRRSQTFVLEEKQPGAMSVSASASPSHSPQPKRLSPQGLKGESPPPSLTVSYPGPSCQEPLPPQGGAGSDPESDVFEPSREVSVCLSLPNGNQQQQQREEEEEEASVSVSKDQEEKQHHHSDQQQQPPKSGRSVVESDV